ncbi:MAG: hypothetical protein BWY82_00642 [Verrucomicrobia bacterium ADurb.Bin474]|nr:MAG: hypothetical protein BWY82_00642 [Verrucomicrobia bacterium ADurb.Bin474]
MMDRDRDLSLIRSDLAFHGISIGSVYDTVLLVFPLNNGCMGPAFGHGNDHR